MKFFQSVAEKIASGAKWAKHMGGAAFQEAKDIGGAARDAVVDGAEWAAGRVHEGYDWGAQEVREGIQWGKEKGRQGIQKTAEGVAWSEQKVKAGAQWVNARGQKAVDDVVGGTAAAIAHAATKYKTVERCLEGMLRNKRIPKEEDGQFMGSDCPDTYPNPPKTGRLPHGCSECAGKFPKIIYVNGVNTEPETSCQTMRKIANDRCAEVSGVYNATFGTIQDVLDAKNSIDRAGRQASAHSQARLIAEMLKGNPSQQVTIFAHSEGGLITQEALGECASSLRQSIRDDLLNQGIEPTRAKQMAVQRTESLISRVEIFSFGTAEREWPPVGARLHQFTNTADPIPKLIAEVQKNHSGYSEPLNLVERHRFEQTAWNPIAPHSMDDTYLPELNRIHPISKNPNGKCC